MEKTKMMTSEQLFVQTLRLKFSDILGDMATHVEIMVYCAIACLESNYGRSRLALEHNNFFGMKSPRKRVTTNLSPDLAFSSYSSYHSSVLDFVIWLISQPCMFRYRFKNSRDLIDYIVDVCGYCPDKGYKDKLIAVYDKIKNW